MAPKKTRKLKKKRGGKKKTKQQPISQTISIAIIVNPGSFIPPSPSFMDGMIQEFFVKKHNMIFHLRTVLFFHDLKDESILQYIPHAYLHMLLVATQSDIDCEVLLKQYILPLGKGSRIAIFKKLVDEVSVICQGMTPITIKEGWKDMCTWAECWAAAKGALTSLGVPLKKDDELIMIKTLNEQIPLTPIEQLLADEQPKPPPSEPIAAWVTDEMELPEALPDEELPHIVDSDGPPVIDEPPAESAEELAEELPEALPDEELPGEPFDHIVDPDGPPVIDGPHAESVLVLGAALPPNKVCSICLEEFGIVLFDTLCVRLPCVRSPCVHAMCVGCFCGLKKTSDEPGSKIALACPDCRQSFKPLFVEDLALPILQQHKDLVTMVTQMFPNDSLGVAQQLLWSKNFCVEAVKGALEDMLDAGAKFKLLFRRQEGNLSSKEKNDIYLTAQLPVKTLQIRLGELLKERHRAFEPDALITLGNEIHSVRFNLAQARKKARDSIYKQLNNVGVMGAEQEHTGSIVVDYHGLHVADMKIMFDEYVLPILPAVKQVTAITGQGRHADHQGKCESRLRKELKKHIEMTENIQWMAVRNNPGALYVLWKGK